MQFKFIFSNSTNPYYNLALEEFLLRNLNVEATNFLLFYYNEPTLVFGKNQNVFLEANWNFLRSNEMKFARRISGGGTVYHDLGNINFCFISKFNSVKVNDYQHSTQLIVNALNEIGIGCYMNERNAILLNTEEKISGSAQFTDRKSILSHGTLLFNTNLILLNKIIEPNNAEILTKSSKSVRSKVGNIASFFPQIASNSNDLIDKIKLKLGYMDEYVLNESENQEVLQLQKDKYETPEWIYDRAANGSIHFEDKSVELDDGLIINSNQNEWIGKRFMELIKD